MTYPASIILSSLSSSPPKLNPGITNSLLKPLTIEDDTWTSFLTGGIV